LRLGTHRVRRRHRKRSEGKHGPLFLPDLLHVVGRLLQGAVETGRRIRDPGCPGFIVVLNFVSLVVGRAGLRDGTAGELMRAVDVISNVDDSSGLEDGATGDSRSGNTEEGEGGVGVWFRAEGSLVGDFRGGVNSDVALGEDAVEGCLEADGLVDQEVILREGNGKPSLEHEGERELEPSSLPIIVVEDRSSGRLACRPAERADPHGKRMPHVVWHPRQLTCGNSSRTRYWFVTRAAEGGRIVR
jgi:hypothetical protein